jgi:hypothetical protein
VPSALTSGGGRTARSGALAAWAWCLELLLPSSLALPLNKLAAGLNLDLHLGFHVGALFLQVPLMGATATPLADRGGRGKGVSDSSNGVLEVARDGVEHLLSPRNITSSAKGPVLPAFLGLRVSAVPEATICGTIKRRPSSSATAYLGAWSCSRLGSYRSPSIFLQVDEPSRRIFFDLRMGERAFP